ncbi:hypothetical protein GAYE_SCF42G5568 [Galdieria yellowstonensis]|uniref:RING-type E3 ubiquitin transferase n=1 Tax=Galdieria yellowstonensis TaxID=3028027 RepID=A0AAV9IJY3_9RHOD|nr:hypothetical protein GAYE_SCF42G5568 [Galdieria yellowstonensis]
MTDLGTTTNDPTEKDWTTNIPVLPLIFESVTCKIPKSLAVSFMTCPLCEQRLKKVTTITSCLHRFCEHCIKMYLQRVHMNCPICGIRLTSLRQLRTDVEYGRLVQELDKGLGTTRHNNQLVLAPQKEDNQQEKPGDSIQMKAEHLEQST